MFEHSNSTGCDFVTYELDADHFDLYPGDMLSPGSELGIDVRAGTIVYLESWGHVATVYYNRMNHSYLTNDTSCQASDSEVQVAKIRCGLCLTALNRLSNIRPGFTHNKSKKVLSGL
jgi:hypothetical protein